MKRYPFRAILPVLMVPAFLSSCNRELDDGPPSFILGDSACIECGMIVSDERFATSTIIMGDRGREALMFDDFNCQINFERKLPELEIVKRWSHDYSSSEWFETALGWFVESPEIHTPMASSLAFFQSRDAADQFSETVNGSTITIEIIKSRLD